MSETVITSFSNRYSENDSDPVTGIAKRMASAKTKGELGTILAEEVRRYTIMDLQIIGGRMHEECLRLPQPYREQVSPFIKEWIMGGYHKLLTMQNSGIFPRLSEPITERDTFDRFCNIICEGCFQGDENMKRMPLYYKPKHRLFYYMISAFTIFVLDNPGHPVGMPFPGGFKVEEKNGRYFCIIRDHEKDLPFSICNFCPAMQTK
jgi:uncharacterized protein (UPF0305 family)